MQNGKDDVTLWYELNRLISDYWADVDEHGGERAHEFYIPTALYAVGGNRFVGESKISAFYARRRASGNTTTRHLISNLRVGRNEPCRARMSGIMSLYRTDGRPPILGSRPPAMIADFEARCVLGDDDRWRFETHLLRPIFVGSDLPASISIDPARL
jgi:hypothetical protein